ncbi:MAG: GreA/GreB family elongation factor [Vicinamibacteria bacterium]
MSKAFTKESEGGPFDDAHLELKDPLPAGVKNYVTPEGASALREELSRLEHQLRPKSKRVEGLDRKIQFLRDRVANMVVVDPGSQDKDSVRFGAFVTVADSEGNEKDYHIVGVDESDPPRGKISWISPIAKALISARVGDVVTLELPDGNTELEILEIEYR